MKLLLTLAMFLSFQIMYSNVIFDNDPIQKGSVIQFEDNTIELQLNVENIKSVKIIDGNSTVVYDGKNDVIEINKLLPGVYFIRIETSSEIIIERLTILK